MISAPARPDADVLESALGSALQQAVLKRIGEARYNVWFKPHTRFRLDEAGLTVGVPNLYFQEWLSKTFAEPVREAVEEIFGRALPVRFLIDAELFRAARAEQATSPPANSPSKPPTSRSAVVTPVAPPRPTGDLFTPPSLPEVVPAVPLMQPRPNGRRFRQLSQFIVGSCNRVAHAAALALVEDPANSPCPLTLHGPVGTGKTHLLEGIYLALRKRWPEGRVLFVTAEEFTNQFVQAMRFNRLATFRKKYRDCDAFLLDDMHFLATKKATVEEFLHTLDSLMTEGRVVVVTTDCHPRLADEVPPELTDRLLGGAIWGLLPPDPTTRLDLLRAKAGSGTPTIPEDVLSVLAEQLRGNVRELEGALASLRHYAKVTNRRIDLPLAREALGDLLRHAVRVVTLADVDRVVCAVLKLSQGTLQTKGRQWAVAHPRMLATFLARKHTAASYGAISQHFGGKSHSTAVAAERTVRCWLQENRSLAMGGREWPARDLVERIERELLA